MNQLILASSCQDRLNSWKLGLAGYESVFFKKDKTVSNRLESLRNEVAKLRPQAVLLDFDLLEMDGAGDLATLQRLSADTRIIILTGAISEEQEWKLMKAGMRGCCKNDISPKLLNDVVMAVLQGELWIRRTLMSRFVDEVGSTSGKNKAYRAPFGLINTLTQREYDIAVRVGNGQNNKLIAYECGITERTVKAHLTEIFLKLGVTDRLNLALLLAADNRIDFTNADGLLSDALVQSTSSKLPRNRLRA